MKKADVLQRIDSTVFRKKMVSDSQEALDEIKEMVGAIPEPLKSDPWIYRTVVILLGFSVLCVVIGAIIITMADKTSPDILVAIGSAAVGALAGLLAPSPAAGE